jgi:hypothetical protein
METMKTEIAEIATGYLQQFEPHQCIAAINTLLICVLEKGDCCLTATEVDALRGVNELLAQLQHEKSMMRKKKKLQQS